MTSSRKRIVTPAKITLPGTGRKGTTVASAPLNHVHEAPTDSLEGHLADVDPHSQYYNDDRGHAAFATVERGVTNGDTHDHSGGDGAQIDHGGLAGLSDDDHAQYLLLAGRTGGQTLNGGTDASDDLVIVSTADATKGEVYIGGDGTTNRLAVESDGTVRFDGGATVWDDDNFAGVTLGVGVSPPDLIAYNGTSIMVRAFDGNAIIEELFGGSEYKHKSQEGQDIQFHIHWSPTTNNAGNVKWQLAYVWVNIDGSATSETVISVVQASNGTAWDKHKVAFPTVSGTGKTIGSQIGVRLFRDPTDASDTYPDDAAITFTFGYHFVIDTGGSRQITTK